VPNSVRILALLFVYINIVYYLYIMNIEQICELYNIKNYTINKDGSIDVDGDVFLYKRNLNKLPLNFNKVSGVFYCDNNELTSLVGAPKEVGGSFYCDNNKLISLKGAPNRVGVVFTVIEII